jgi:hypothetical protein
MVGLSDAEMSFFLPCRVRRVWLSVPFVLDFPVAVGHIGVFGLAV